MSRNFSERVNKYRGSRLKFKRSTSKLLKDVNKETLDGYISLEEHTTHGEPQIAPTPNFHRGSKQKDNNQQHSEQRKSELKRLKLEEWGPPINGYRFISTAASSSTKHMYYHQRHNLAFGKDQDQMNSYSSFQSSYEGMPEFRSSVSNNLTHPKHSEASSENSIDQFQQYIRHWETVKTEKIRTLKFPVFHGDVINVINIERFFKEAYNSQEDYISLLKKERIKWHPDKLYWVRSTRDSEAVRWTFQCINNLWENAQN